MMTRHSDDDSAEALLADLERMAAEGKARAEQLNRLDDGVTCIEMAADCMRLGDESGDANGLPYMLGTLAIIVQRLRTDVDKLLLRASLPW